MSIRLSRSNVTATSKSPTQSCLHHNEYRNSFLCISRHDFTASFHNASIRAAPQDPYNALGLSPSATAGEIKKKFYELSRTHHPDHNPKNQEEASKKFMEISNAYSILGNPASREKYDREHGAKPSTSGSYSSAQASYSPGGRKASGLSRRRTQFRGPPPSYYRNGGWTNQSSAGRSQEAASGGTASNGQTGNASGPFAGQAGKGEGAWPFQTDPNDVPHFDRDRHYRVTTSLAEQMQSSRKKRRMAFERDQPDLDDDSTGAAIGRFFMVGAMLSIGIAVPALFFGSTG